MDGVATEGLATDGCGRASRGCSKDLQSLDQTKQRKSGRRLFNNRVQRCHLHAIQTTSSRCGELLARGGLPHTECALWGVVCDPGCHKPLGRARERQVWVTGGPDRRGRPPRSRQQASSDATVLGQRFLIAEGRNVVRRSESQSMDMTRNCCHSDPCPTRIFRCRFPAHQAKSSERLRQICAATHARPGDGLPVPGRTPRSVHDVRPRSIWGSKWSPVCRFARCIEARPSWTRQMTNRWRGESPFGRFAKPHPAGQ